MAPLYDAVTTRVFPRLKHDHMALTSTASMPGTPTTAAPLGVATFDAAPVTDGLNISLE
jgi:hypothetical protein